ncbi:MAG: fatty acid cis/trans isomerase [Nannocystaceae bacterium]|nr:fatty acid cis/trans isomerase [Nannocystaceae bacterium]
MDEGDAIAYTMTRVTEHRNVAYLFGDDRRREPEGDTLAICRRDTGSYPDLMWSILAVRAARMHALKLWPRVVGLALGLSVSATALAADPVVDPEESAQEQPAADEAFTGADVRSDSTDATPNPREAGGVVEGDPGAHRAVLWAPRAVLYVPRLAVRAVAMPLRGFAFLYDRYQLPTKFANIFFMDDGKAAILPLANIETGNGGQYGARMFHKDLFGKRERISGRVLFGTLDQRFVGFKASSGDRLSSIVAVTAAASYWQARSHRFFGIGNNDVAELPSADRGAETIDPLADATAIDTRFKADTYEYRGGLRFKVARGLSLNLWTTLAYRSFTNLRRGESSSVNTTSVYERDSLVGYRNGLAASQTGLRLTFNNFRRVAPWISAATPSTGWKLLGEAEYTDGIRPTDPSQFVTYKFDVQRLINLYRGDRVLHLRLHWEGVTGPLRRVPFVRLPQLGGPVQLRGYPRFRFRDRLATFSVVEYRYPIGEVATGYLFFDSGRTFRSYSDIKFQKWRVGGGPGLIFHTRQDFLARIFVAFANDGSVFFNLNFDPLST